MEGERCCGVSEPQLRDLRTPRQWRVCSPCNDLGCWKIPRHSDWGCVGLKPSLTCQRQQPHVNLSIPNGGVTHPTLLLKKVLSRFTDREGTDTHKNSPKESDRQPAAPSPHSLSKQKHCLSPCAFLSALDSMERT